MKIVINRCYGGFSLSENAFAELGIKWDGYGYILNEDMGIASDNYYAYRADRRLVAAVEKLGEAANGSFAQLKVVNVPSDVDWEIDEYDGMESVNEKHRSWC